MNFRLRTVTKLALWKLGHFDKAKRNLKMLPAFWNFDTLENLDLSMEEMCDLYIKGL